MLPFHVAHVVRAQRMPRSLSTWPPDGAKMDLTGDGESKNASGVKVYRKWLKLFETEKLQLV